MESLTKIFGALVTTFLAPAGTSVSQVGRIQAENKQKNDGFWSLIDDAIAGVFVKAVSFLGGGDSSPRALRGTTVTPEELRGVDAVAERNAETATLMHGLKLHQRLRDALETMDLRPFVAEAMPQRPQQPAAPKSGSTCDTRRFMDLSSIDEMIENLSPEVLAQFDFAFWQEAIGLNSRAAAIGKLLSENGAFFRKLAAPLPKGSEQPTQNGVIITTWERAYDSGALEGLSRMRDELQARYDDLQKRLNSCRKQIKDAVREYNLAHERRYQAEFGAYQLEVKAYELEMERLRSAAETLRQQALQEIAGLQVRTE